MYICEDNKNKRNNNVKATFRTSFHRDKLYLFFNSITFKNLNSEPYYPELILCRNTGEISKQIY